MISLPAAGIESHRQHPRLSGHALEVVIGFEACGQEGHSPVDALGLEVVACVACGQEAIEDIGGHGGVAVVCLPPSPASVCVLVLPDLCEPCQDHLPEFCAVEDGVFPALCGFGFCSGFAVAITVGAVLDGEFASSLFGLLCDGSGAFAEVLQLVALISQGFGGDDARKEARHGLLDAAVGVLVEVGEGIEDDGGEGGMDLHDQLRDSGFACFG